MWTPDSVFVISLARRPDRRAGFTALLSRLGFEAPFFDALDGRQLEAGGFAGPVGALGCARSHAAALGLAHGITLVLEDDAAIPYDFQGRLLAVLSELPPDWLVLTLGTSRRLIPDYVSPHVARLARFARTHAYLLHGGEAIEAMREIAATANNHWDVAASTALCPTGRVYAPLHPMIEQRVSASDISQAPR